MRLFKPTYKTEEDLIKGCIKGHTKAQRLLYDKYSPVLYSICLRYLKSNENAEESLSNGFIKIFDNIKTKKETTSLEGWMKKIIVNECLQIIRKQKGTFLYLDDINTEPFNSVKETSYDAEKILRAIKQLPLGYRTIFNLYTIEDYKHKDIAEKLNISVGTSKSQYFKAKNMIKRYLQKEDISSKKRES